MRKDIEGYLKNLIVELPTLNSSERVDIFRTLDNIFCIHCGDLHKESLGRKIYCQCWNDE